MVKVNKKNKAKNKTFEFLTIFSMVFGIVVGGAIYLKNSDVDGGVLKEAKGNPWIALAVWVFIGVLCSMIMLTFIEAASCQTKLGHTTMQSWANMFISRRCASLFSIMYICMYLPVLTGIGALFTVKSLFDGINVFYISQTKEPGGLVKLMGATNFMILKIALSTVLLLAFSLINIYTSKPSKIIQQVFTFVKFIPLLTLVIGGIIMCSKFSGDNSFNPNNIGKASTLTFFATMVPILFAFDGFIYAATLQKDCEHKEVVAPAMLSAIIAVTLFYVVITVSIFLVANDGNVFKFFEKLFEKYPQVNLLYRIIISCTLFTVVNGYTTLIPRTIHSAIEEGFIYSKAGAGKFSLVKSGFIGMAIDFAIYFTFIGISIAINKKDDLGEIDYFLVTNYSSNSTVMFAFVAYIILMIAVIHNRRTNKVNVRKVKGGYIMSTITVSLLFIIMGYTFYDFFVNKFKDEYKIKRLDPLLLIGFSFIIFILWIVNECLLSKHDIDNNQFILRLNPKNWGKNFDKDAAIKAYKEKHNIPLNTKPVDVIEKENEKEVQIIEQQ